MLRKVFLLFLIFFAGKLFAQISPGELSSVHTQLEGVDKCTECHSVGKALSNTNCLKCHTEIDSRIQQKKGYHSTINNKQCAECHKDHHGKEFQIIRFDTKKFDHSTVGFVLDGKHKLLDCRKCHIREKISAKDIQKLSDDRKGRSFLGLGTTCISCHVDQHKGQFTSECNQCHTTEKWKPATKFLHERTKYPLTGKHKKVECYTCHKNKLDDGKTVQFTKIEFSECSSCHIDPHKGKFQQKCSACHTTDDFHKVNKGQFEHASTKFPLKGKHATIKCEQCHAANPKTKNASGELGYHITKYQECSNCHADAHAKQFLQRIDKGKCESCHGEDGFLIVRFSYSDHAKTKLALIGGHAAVPCGQCHLSGKVQAKSTRQFHWEKKFECRTCHEDIHKGQFAQKMTNGCETCHSVTSWQTLKFDHEKTKFTLQGKHAKIACIECHKVSEDKSLPVKYVGVALQCSSCHKDQHEGQLTLNGKTECERCHVSESWKKLSFDHNKQSKYLLDGKHASVACEKCHLKISINDRLIVKYKPLGVTCADCHSN